MPGGGRHIWGIIKGIAIYGVQGRILIGRDPFKWSIYRYMGTWSYRIISGQKDFFNEK